MTSVLDQMIGPMDGLGLLSELELDLDGREMLTWSQT